MNKLKLGGFDKTTPEKKAEREIDWWVLTFMGLSIWTFITYFYTLYKIFEWVL